jgi:hypothetical protein
MIEERALDRPPRLRVNVARCGWCGRETAKPQGRCLETVARGRSICVGCGRFANHCECETTVSGAPTAGYGR